MSEETNEGSGFKVVDRRPFTEEGARRADAQMKEERAEAETPRAAAATAQPASAETKVDDHLDERFAMLVELLTNGALTHLGLMDGGAGEPLAVNLPGARAMIDLLGVIEDKTKGNLSQAEQKFLGEVLFELHTRFVEAQRQAAPKRR
ncbi:MAG: DUF1844 domain-containing protein [Terriglobia bacterium]